MAKIKQKARGLAGKKGLKGITEAAIAVQVIAVALIIVVEIAGLMKDRELDLEKLGIKRTSPVGRLLQRTSRAAEEDATKEKTETDVRI